MLRPAQIAELRSTVSEDGVITALTSWRPTSATGSPTSACFPQPCCCRAVRDEVQASCASARATRFLLSAAAPAPGLSGGALPAAGGVVISLARMNRILKVDIPNRLVVVEPGVINAHVTQRVAPQRLLLRARPIVAIGVHHRRQRGGKLRRRALPEIWIYGDAYAGA